MVAVSLTKIANDLRYLGSGPRAGLAEIFLPELQKGSSIMPGKVNPVIPEVVTQVAAQVIGNDTAIAIGGMQGHFELNVFIPMMARNLLDSIKLLASASRLLADKCVSGIEANREQCESYAELTLSAATALNPHIGYDKASEIVKKAAASGRSLREVAREEGVDDAILDEALDYRAMAKPHDGPEVREAVSLVADASGYDEAISGREAGCCALARGTGNTALTAASGCWNCACRWEATRLSLHPTSPTASSPAPHSWTVRSMARGIAASAPTTLAPRPTIPASAARPGTELSTRRRPPGCRRVALLVGAVARADERAGEDRAEAERLALLAEPAELVGMHPAVDRGRASALGWRYWPIVTTSTPCARRSRIVSTTSSFVSPSPTMMPLFVSTG